VAAGVILDAGPLVALLDRREQFHAWASAQVASVHSHFVTCDAALCGTFFLISRDPVPGLQLRKFLKNGSIQSRFDLGRNLPEVLGLMDRYESVPMSFADACLVRMAELNPGFAIFTLDRDFTIYRQHKRRIIPLIAPF
jgi:predicted nucleic acid-binding protein